MHVCGCAHARAHTHTNTEDMSTSEFMTAEIYRAVSYCTISGNGLASTCCQHLRLISVPN